MWLSTLQLVILSKRFVTQSCTEDIREATETNKITLLLNDVLTANSLLCEKRKLGGKWKGGFTTFEVKNKKRAKKETAYNQTVSFYKY